MFPCLLNSLIEFSIIFLSRAIRSMFEQRLRLARTKGSCLNGENVQPCLAQTNKQTAQCQLVTGAAYDWPAHMDLIRRPRGAIVRTCLGCLNYCLRCIYSRYILKATGTPCTGRRSTWWTLWAWSYRRPSSSTVTSPRSRGSMMKSLERSAGMAEEFYVYLCFISDVLDF